MKKRSQKPLLIIIVILISMVTLMTLQTAAISSKTKLDNIEYYSKDIPKEKLEQIVRSIYGTVDDIPATPKNILCIFGHSKAMGGMTTIEHNYYSTAPRCRETNSNVEYCTRSGCDYFTVLNTSYNRMSCH